MDQDPHRQGSVEVERGMSDDKVDPWDREQLAVIADEGITVDGVELPGVFGREVTVEYQDSTKAKWPIRMVIGFYLDKLEIPEELEEFVEFTTRHRGPQEVKE